MDSSSDIVSKIIQFFEDDPKLQICQDKLAGSSLLSHFENLWQILIDNHKSIFGKIKISEELFLKLVTECDKENRTFQQLSHAINYIPRFSESIDRMNKKIEYISKTVIEMDRDYGIILDLLRQNIEKDWEMTSKNELDLFTKEKKLELEAKQKKFEIEKSEKLQQQFEIDMALIKSGKKPIYSQRLKKKQKNRKTSLEKEDPGITSNMNELDNFYGDIDNDNNDIIEEEK